MPTTFPPGPFWDDEEDESEDDDVGDEDEDDDLGFGIEEGV